MQIFNKIKLLKNFLFIPNVNFSVLPPINTNEPKNLFNVLDFLKTSYVQILNNLSNPIFWKLFILKYKRISGIYLLFNNLTGLYYIGQAVDLKERIYNYKNIKKDSTRYIDNAIRKYGFNNFTVVILETFNLNYLPTTQEKVCFLNEKENYYFSVYKPQYNIRSFP